jgi:hypothetical protein
VQQQVTTAAMGLIAGGGFAGLLLPKLDLITAFSGLLTKASTLSQATLAAYTGYAGPVTATLSAAYISNPSGLYAADTPDAVFNGPTSGAGANVIGAVLHGVVGAVDTLYAAVLFDGPLSENLITDRVTVGMTLLLNMGLATELAS